MAGVSAIPLLFGLDPLSKETGLFMVKLGAEDDAIDFTIGVDMDAYGAIGKAGAFNLLEDVSLVMYTNAQAGSISLTRESPPSSRKWISRTRFHGRSSGGPHAATLSWIYISNRCSNRCIWFALPPISIYSIYVISGVAGGHNTSQY